METNENQKNNSKTLDSDKYYFAAYLNMARHNAFITLAHITRILGKNPAGEDQLAEMYAIKIFNPVNNSLSEDILKAKKLIDKHFPFVKYLVNINDSDPEVYIAEKYHKVLNQYSTLLNDYRNYYTHTASAAKVDLQPDFNNGLESIFDLAVNEVVKRFTLKEEEINHLRRKSPENTEIDNSTFKYRFRRKSLPPAFNENGMAFFICLFLEKNYSYLFLKQITGFKKDGTPGFRASLEAYTVYRTRIPKIRIDAEQNREMTLAMDMLGELKKCPRELYDVLQPEYDNKFRAKLNSDDGENEEDDYETENLFLRNGSRFSYLALSFIDTNNLLPGYSFHIDLGNYYFRFYSKMGADGIERKRNIKKHLLTYGNLVEAHQQKKVQWGLLEKENHEIPENNEEPYITNTYPHYHIQNNQVGLFSWNNIKTELPELKGKDTKTKAPDIWLSTYELPAIIFYALLCKKQAAIPPETIIANHIEKIKQLFSDIHTGICKPKLSQMNADEYIKQFESHYVSLSDIPKPLKEYLLGETFPDKAFEDYAHDMIKKLFDDTAHRLKQLDKQIIKDEESKPGVNGEDKFNSTYDNMKAGRMAAFLATDMLMMQPSVSVNELGIKDGKDKATGFNFQILQSCLALYGANHHKLYHIFENCKLINSPIPHPFLKDINLPTLDTLSAFYKQYLIERKKYLGICTLEKNYHAYYFLKPGERRWHERNDEYYRQLAHNYLNGFGKEPNKLGFNLPRSLFTPFIKSWFARFGNTEMKLLIKEESQQKHNAAFLITKYFELNLNDKVQPFYDFPRSYFFTDKYFSLQKSNKWPEEFTTEFLSFSELCNKSADFEKFYKDLGHHSYLDDKQRQTLHKDYHNYLKNEKLIRLAQTTDMVLFMAVQHIFEKLKVADTEEFKLSAIQTPDTSDILSLQCPFSLNIAVYHTDEKGNVKRKETPLAYKKITQTDLKIKNFGDFMRFTADRRLNELLKYLPQEEVSRADLQRELEEYDTCRLAVAKIIHTFENKMILRFSNEMNAMLTQHSYIEFKEISKLFYTAFTEHLADCIKLESIRNAFMHNQYPRPEDVGLAEVSFPGIALQLCQQAENVVQIFTQKLTLITNTQ